MEFLPPDIAPLHDPAASVCVPEICLDPRRAAEEACAAALGQIAAQSPIARLWKDIELSLNTPQESAPPDIESRATTIFHRENLKTTAWGQARILYATAPVFADAFNGEPISEQAVRRSYINIGYMLKDTVNQLNTARVDGVRAALVGRVAELAVHGVLLRSGKNIPFLASPREEASSQTLLNHDIAVFPADKGRGTKIPVQVGAGVKPAETRQHRVLPLGLTQFVRDNHLRLPKGGGKTYMTLASLLIDDMTEQFSGKSPQGRFLNGFQKALDKTIETCADEFQAGALSEGIRNFVIQAMNNKVSSKAKLARGTFSPSLYIKNSAGIYVFADEVTAVQSTDSLKRPAHRIHFGYRGERVSSITAIQTRSKTILNRGLYGKAPDTADRLIARLHDPALKIQWDQSR